MGAPRIKRQQSVGAMIRAHRQLKKRATVDPTTCAVTIVIHQETQDVLGVGVTRDAAARLRDSLPDGEHCELKDFFLSV